MGRYPFWEFALDEEGEEGQDEATARPRPGSGLAAHEVFPVEVTSRVLVEGESTPRRVIVPGFQYRNPSREIVEAR